MSLVSISRRREKGEGRREKGEGRREKGEGRREKGEGRREKGEGRREKGEGRREKGEGRREKGEGRREKGEGRREKGEGRREKGEGRREKGNGKFPFFSFNFSEVIMPKKRRFINKNHEEKARPDSPDGLLVAASKNKDFARRLVSEFRKLQGVKHGCNSHQS